MFLAPFPCKVVHNCEVIYIRFFLLFHKLVFGSSGRNPTLRVHIGDPLNLLKTLHLLSLVSRWMQVTTAVYFELIHEGTDVTN